MSETEDERARRLLTRGEKAQMARRFYKQASVAGDAPPFEVLLDGRSIRTPMKAPLALPNLQLAEAVQAEWLAQDDVIDPSSMPVTRLANTAIDRVNPDRDRIVGEIVEFAGSDLLCYRADSPEGLVARQCETWDPVLSWIAKTHRARFIAVTGLIHEAQPEPTIAAVTGFLTQRDDFALTAIHNLTTLTGSCILALALYGGRLTPDEAWDAAHLDEDWQIELWGEDEEASARRAIYRREFDATLDFMRLAGTPTR